MSTLHKYINRAKVVFNEDGLIGLFNGIIDRVLLRGRFFIIYRLYRKYLCRLRYGQAAADPYKIIRVDPCQIEFWRPNHDRYDLPSHGIKVLSEDGYKINVWKDAGEVISGDWDKEKHLVKINRMPKYQGLKQHFRNGVPWENTKLLDILEKIVEKEGMIDGCTSREELSDRYVRIDELYESIAANGYRPMSEIPGKVGPRESLDEIGVVIGRDGSIIFQGGGWHRLTISKLLDIDSIPVRVIARHAEWQQTREEFANCSDSSKLYIELQSQLDHPDLQDVTPDD